MKKGFLLVALLLSIGMKAQTLSLQESIDMVLKNNFDIRISRNEADIDKLNNTAGNAGMLPTVKLNGSSTLSYNNVYQKSSSGTISKYPHQASTDLGADAMLSWTLYDGGKMFITKKRLSQTI